MLVIYPENWPFCLSFKKQTKMIVSLVTTFSCFSLTFIFIFERLKSLKKNIMYIIFSNHT